MLLGDDTIHSVTNPKTTFTGAIHIYGGDFFAQPRSEWDPVTNVEAPYNVERMLTSFEAANAHTSGWHEDRSLLTWRSSLHPRARWGSNDL